MVYTCVCKKEFRLKSTFNCIVDFKPGETYYYTYSIHEETNSIHEKTKELVYSVSGLIEDLPECLFVELFDGLQESRDQKINKLLDEE